MAAPLHTSHTTRILLVEDDSHIGRIIEMALLELGVPYEFASALSAEEGLHLWEEHPFDVLLTDYNLRGMNGVQLIEALRVRGFTPRVLLITAYDSSDLRHELDHLHIDAYVTKPFFMDDLVMIVRKLMQPPVSRAVNG
ncbi:response regulator receiver protein [Oscillochloris trichoides DG-6]|uniref:Response regulator receiver protein n=1 Tax=Oscillochloris trichoides DG-6 TaxID=765420 RepID=E1IFM2_9CHLR|nr:response regulator [Oscillochloris trichoides]EFO80038.1 response regulator receiver protein [Oscillochloris trichoides DG-6]